MRTKAARDHNEPEIVDALRKAGYFVTPLSGGGVPDLLVICPNPLNEIHVVETAEEALKYAASGCISLLEVKQKNGRLTPAQKRFFANALAEL